MISIVICSRFFKIDSFLQKNIAKTIGDVPYEIIYIDNHDNVYSIFEAYNIGFERAKYPIVCFMHEDICLETNNWGKYVLDCFKDESVGMCGVIGSKYISDVPCGWWFCYSRRGHIIEKKGNVKSSYVCSTNNKESVACVDGLWFCIRKSIYPNVKFDSAIFHGFHCYDMDISLQVLSNGYDIKLLSTIDICHNSHGCLNNSFYLNTLLLYKKWANKLPIFVDLQETEIQSNELYICQEISMIGKEHYFFIYVHSFIYKSLCQIEKIININVDRFIQYFYLLGFKIWLRYLNFFHYA